MRGIDDLLILLEFLIDESTVPEGVKEALERLKTRQAEQRLWDEQT